MGYTIKLFAILSAILITSAAHGDCKDAYKWISQPRHMDPVCMKINRFKLNLEIELAQEYYKVNREKTKEDSMYYARVCRRVINLLTNCEAI